MSITVFVALQSFTSLLDTSRGVQDMSLGDYAVTNETVGIAPESIDKIRENEMVENLSTAKLSVYTQDENGKIPIEHDFELQSWESFQIAGIDDIRLSAYEMCIRDSLLDTAIFLKMSNFNTPNVISFLKKKTAAEM